jgi:hypothetical protein
MAATETLPPLAEFDPSWTWAPYEPDQQPAATAKAARLPWDLVMASHLYRRAGFSANWGELQHALAVGPQEAVTGLLAGGERAGEFYTDLQRMAEPLLAGGNVQNLPAWWSYAMVHSPHPLLEKAALFWHGHFATSAAKVENARLLHQQNQMLRGEALGNFRTLVEQISRDPAMLLWLDSATNHKLKPNENYARELMELFALGIGNYAEDDVKQSARAFTGWEVRDGQFRFNPYQHDDGEKSVLGQRGRWNGDDVVRIVLEQPAAPWFVVGKLFRFFVSEAQTMPDQIAQPLVDGFRNHDYSVGYVIETLLRSNLFFSRYALRQKIKSPAELAVGLVRALELNVSTYTLAEAMRDMGQRLFFPPTVKGWDGGEAWINTSSLLARANVVPRLLAGSVRTFGPPSPLVEWVRQQQLAGPEETLDRLLDVLLASALEDAVRNELLESLQHDWKREGPSTESVTQVVHALTAMPEFQLC